MNETFKVISDFLERTSGEVEGRAREEMPAEVASLLKAFAAGTLEPDVRANLADLLKAHPSWVSALAGETRALRSGDSPAG